MTITTLNDPDNWTVQVTNPSGGGSSSAFPFRVVAPTPVIGSLTTNPTTPTAGVSFTFTISGSGFYPAGALILITGPSCSPRSEERRVGKERRAWRLAGAVEVTT